MKNGFKGTVVALGIVSMMAAGCAKEEVVKKDEPIAPPVVAQPVKPVEPPPVQQEAPKPQQEVVVAPTAPEVIALETVYFDFDKSDLRKDSRDALSKNAETLLKQAADAKIQIAGHCDERGSDEYNLALGERRAKSVAKYLTTLGVKADRISTISYGKEKPAVQGNGEAAWSKNRRAEFVIVK
mgnify:CR=1 FL=1|jgi:peptidoglycan-associated lipoprotein